MIFNPNNATREAFRLARIEADKAEARVLRYLLERELERAMREEFHDEGR